ncbi:MAG: helix-turn-helix domain-containing protein [Treponema sp.]|nr:helix-turn-helix domain-containing protein [Treponema sp.]
MNAQGLRVLLGKRILFHRKQRRFSQAVLAEKADISITFLSQIERGIKYPTSQTLSCIVNALGVDVYELFQKDEIPKEHQILLARFKNDVLKSVEAVYSAYEE